MDVQAVTTLVGSLGFPIACALGMFIMWDKERQEHKAEVVELTKNMTEQSAKTVEAINNNTLALTKLVERISYGDSKN